MYIGNILLLILSVPLVCVVLILGVPARDPGPDYRADHPPGRLHRQQQFDSS